MIRRKQELVVLKRENVKNGKGIFINELLLNEDEFYHKGRLFARCKLAPGDFVGNHTHEQEMEVCYFLSGKGMVESNGIISEVNVGDVHIVHPGENHSVINKGTEDLEYIALILYAI